MKIIYELYRRDLDYFFQYQNLCVQNLCAQLLQIYHVPNYHLRMNCNWEVKIVSGDEHNPRFRLLYDQTPLITDLSSQMFFYSNGEYNKQRIWEIDCSYIDRDIPVIIGVDQYYLSYHEQYQKKNGAHTIILCGYNDEEKIAYIKDWYSDYKENRTIDYDTLDKARSSENSWNMGINSGGTINYASLILYMEQLHGHAHHLESTFRMIKQWYDVPLSTPPAGVNILPFIEGYFSDCKEDIQERAEYIHTQLYGLYLRKKLFYHYLTDAQPFLDTSLYNQYMPHVEELQEIWKSWMLLFVFISQATRKDRVHQLLEQYRTCYQRLIQFELIQNSFMPSLLNSILR